MLIGQRGLVLSFSTNQMSLRNHSKARESFELEMSSQISDLGQEQFDEIEPKAQ